MHRQRRNWISRSLATTALFLWMAGAAVAGIPEPGIILYGQVLDEDGQLVTTGELSWTYSPSGGGDPLVVSTTLTALEGPGGPYSYTALIPFEIPIDGYPAQSNALTLTATPSSYTRNGQVIGGTIQTTHVVTLSRADRGKAIRVDVCLTCGPNTATIHSADVNEDYTFSLGEFLRVIEFYNATLTHDYHLDPSGEDGFGVGFGPRGGDPHSSDYYGGADWRLSLNEVVRIIDLFASTNDHAYSADPMAADGFKKGGAQAGSAKSAARSFDPSVSVTRELAAYSIGGGGANLELTLRVSKSGSEALSALAIRESLPPGWTYAGLTGGVAPLNDPAASNPGTLEFAWYPVPPGLFTLSYSVVAVGSESPAQAMAGLRGTAIYRTVAGDSEFQATVLATGDIPSDRTMASNLPAASTPGPSEGTSAGGNTDGTVGGIDGSHGAGEVPPPPAEPPAALPLAPAWPLAALVAILGIARLTRRASRHNP